MDYERIRKERRFKILSFDYNEVLDLIVVSPSTNMKIKRVALPPECYVDGVYYDPPSMGFNFVIGSEDFPSIVAGGTIQICNDEIEYSVIELNHGKDFRIVEG